VQSRFADSLGDLSDVRVHTEDTADKLNRAVSARESRSCSTGAFDLNGLHLSRHVVWKASDLEHCEAFLAPDGRPIRFDRNADGAPFLEDFQRRLRSDGLPITKVLSGD